MLDLHNFPDDTGQIPPGRASEFIQPLILSVLLVEKAEMETPQVSTENNLRILLFSPSMRFFIRNIVPDNKAFVLSSNDYASVSVITCMQNTKTRLVTFFLKNLTEHGIKLVSAVMADGRMYANGQKKLRDITASGGFSSMTGMDIWQLMSIVLLVFRSALRNNDTMVSTILVRQDVKNTL